MRVDMNYVDMNYSEHVLIVGFDGVGSDEFVNR